MQTIYIKFLTEDDRVRGFYELATRSRIASLQGGVYQVPLEALKLLENQQIGYRRSTDAKSSGRSFCKRGVNPPNAFPGPDCHR